MKFAIVNIKTKIAAYAYDSDKPEQGTNVFGGAWDDPKQFEHILIPSDLGNEPLDQLEPYDGEIQVGTQMVQVGESPAYDEQKKPIKGLLGAQLMVPKFEEQPIMQPKRLMRRKS